MKNKSLISVIVIFVLIMVAAVIAYPRLSEKAISDELTVSASDESSVNESLYEETTENDISEEITSENISAEITSEEKQESETKEITQENISESSSQENTTSAVQYRKVESFTCYDKDGNEVSLESYLDKPVILNFWATWCGYCIREMPDFQKAYEQYGDEINFLIINTDDSISEGEKFITDMGYTFPTYYDLDREAIITYSITGIPRTIAIDKDGNIIYNRAGMINETQLLSIIDSIL